MAAMIVSLALSSRTLNDLAVERFWLKPEHREAGEVMAKVPPDVAVSAQDQYVAHLSLRPLVFVFPTGIEKADCVLVNAAIYPWRSLPDVTMRQEDAETVTIRATAAGPGTIPVGPASPAGEALD